jgi:hypothetical protein
LVRSKYKGHSAKILADSYMEMQIW